MTMKQFDQALIGPEWMDLVQEFPEIFLEPSPYVLEKKGWNNIPDKEEDLCNLRFGFELDCGWKEIIREFCQDVRILVQRAKDNGHEIHFKTFILKEKFGEIANQGDFYGPDRNTYYDEYREISNNLIKKSLKTCEITGNPGKLVNKNYWCKTLCEEKAEKWLNYEKV